MMRSVFRLLRAAVCAGMVLLVGGMAHADNTLAVWDFDNNSLGSVGAIEAMEPYRRILPEALMAQLADLPGLRLVERIRLRELLDELKLGSSELADRDTRLRVGRLLGARYMMFGDYLALGPVMRVDVRLVDSETSRILVSEQLTGTPDGVLANLPTLAAPLMRALGVAQARATRVRASHEVWQHYARGLALQDAGDHERAFEQFRAALMLDAGFKPAERQLQWTLERMSRTR